MNIKSHDAEKLPEEKEVSQKSTYYITKTDN